MDRRQFLKTCSCAVVGAPVIGLLIQSCGAIYYASSEKARERLIVPKSEFTRIRNDKTITRKYVLVQREGQPFPICLREQDGIYTAARLECTHNGCELNIAGSRYTCPCHGSEFSLAGKVLEGPAVTDLKMYKTDQDNENIYIYYV